MCPSNEDAYTCACRLRLCVRARRPANVFKFNRCTCAAVTCWGLEKRQDSKCQGPGLPTDARTACCIDPPRPRRHAVMKDIPWVSRARCACGDQLAPQFEGSSRKKCVGVGLVDRTCLCRLTSFLRCFECSIVAYARLHEISSPHGGQAPAARRQSPSAFSACGAWKAQRTHIKTTVRLQRRDQVQRRAALKVVVGG
jgi:hypothetical protein